MILITRGTLLKALQILPMAVVIQREILATLVILAIRRLGDPATHRPAILVTRLLEAPATHRLEAPAIHRRILATILHRYGLCQSL
ncbi:hypothetical protein ccbrp13_10150 [Ktedonobacteria bacterium brp13]|nr:hypothetical protein ccbrp13_10150 [Ktedonobacteria bacterium brp13]